MLCSTAGLKQLRDKIRKLDVNGDGKTVAHLQDAEHAHIMHTILHPALLVAAAWQ
jgi:hypothetical protein